MKKDTCIFTVYTENGMDTFAINNEAIAEDIWCGLLDGETADYVKCENGFGGAIAEWYNPSHKYKVVTYNKHGDRDGLAHFNCFEDAKKFWYDVADVTDIYHYPTIWKMNGTNWERVQGW